MDGGQLDVCALKQPLGMVGIVSPFNFPAMAPIWFFPIAITAGNAVIVKPSENVESLPPHLPIWRARSRDARRSDL